MDFLLEQLSFFERIAVRFFKAIVATMLNMCETFAAKKTSS